MFKRVKFFFIVQRRVCAARLVANINVRHLRPEELVTARREESLLMIRGLALVSCWTRIN